jgi:PAS domain S-box-containing protein
MLNDFFDGKAGTTEELVDLFHAYQQAININIITSITDTTGKIVYVNNKFCEVSKYSVEELIGQNHRIINSGYHPQEFFRRMWETISSGKPWHEEIKNKAKDGTFYWVDTVVLPVGNKEGKTTHYLSLRTLITEKKQAELENREYMQKLSEMLHLTSHKVRKPLTTCLGLMTLFEAKNNYSPEKIKEMIGYLKGSAVELDEFTRELVAFMIELEKKYDKKREIN